MQTVSDIKQQFIDLYRSNRIVVDRTGSKTIEIIGASFLADKTAIFGRPSEEYIKKELEWYDSQSNNINDIYGSEREPPQAWLYSANQHGEINSNYGRIIYSETYYNQFDKVVEELVHNPNSRRATMIYTRPSIWAEAFENGKNDFICTNAVSYYIRNNKLDVVVQMRSNDAIFGYKNDRAWAQEVQRRLRDELNNHIEMIGEDYIQTGNIYWQVQNLHVYERHFSFLNEADTV